MLEKKTRRNLQMTLRPYIRHRPKKQHWSSLSGSLKSGRRIIRMQ
nr:MAG TPA: hypothetical protein [Caudoviricetes sp.]